MRSRHPLIVDTRYRGAHGIARYSQEVLPQLSIDWTPFASRVSLGSAIDVLNWDRARLDRRSVLYSPGYFAGIARCRQLLTVHDLIHLIGPQAQQSKRLYYDRVVRPAICRAGTVITVSETSAEMIRDWLNDDSVCVVNAGNGCSPVFRGPVVPADLGRPYFLYVGNLKPHKNPRPVFEAMEKFRDHYLVAVTADRQSAARLAQDTRLNDRLKVYSNVQDDHLHALYAGADALVFPSIIEGFGLPVVEALRAGTKVVFFEGADSVKEICCGTQFAVSDATSSESFAEGMRLSLYSSFTAPTNLNDYDWTVVGQRVDAVIAGVL